MSNPTTVRAEAGGRIVELSSAQRSESVHPQSLWLMYGIAVVASCALIGHLNMGLSLAPAMAVLLRLMLSRLKGVSDVAVSLTVLCIDLIFLMAGDLRDFTSQEAFGLLPLAGYACILLFDLIILKPAPNRLAMAGGATSMLLLVHLSVGQSLVRSVLICAAFLMIWVAMATRRSPALTEPGAKGSSKLRNLRFGLKNGLLIMALSVPLTATFFVLFPRLPIEMLRSDQSERAGATIGLSNSLSLGSISALQKSNEPAFSVMFRGQSPKESSLYWRAMVLDRLDGGTWSSSMGSSQPTRVQPYPATGLGTSPGGTAPGIGYVSTWDASNNNPYPVVLDGTVGRLFVSYNNRNSALMPRSDGTYAVPILDEDNGSVRTKINSVAGLADPAYRLDAGIDPASPDMSNMDRWTTLPPNFNPRTQAFGKDLKSKYQSDEKVISAFLNLVENEDYHYTLKPPKLGAQAIDEFFLNTRAGFCEHYASAFVVAMRGAGIPARLISGYLSAGALDARVKVSQGDAHAWAEVWLPGRGWIRQDPTASISPSRVDPDASNARLESAPEGFAGFVALNWAKFSFKAERAWAENMLGFDADRQAQVFQKLGLTRASKPLLLIAATLLVLGLSFFWQYFGAQARIFLMPRSGSALSRLLARQCSRAGLNRSPGQTWRDVAQTCGDRLGPSDATELMSIVVLYERVAYAKFVDEAVAQALIRRIAAFKPVKAKIQGHGAPAKPT